MGCHDMSTPDGSISRAVVSGRILYRERVRDALKGLDELVEPK